MKIVCLVHSILVSLESLYSGHQQIAYQGRFSKLHLMEPSIGLVKAPTTGLATGLQLDRFWGPGQRICVSNQFPGCPCGWSGDHTD